MYDISNKDTSTTINSRRLGSTVYKDSGDSSSISKENSSQNDLILDLLQKISVKQDDYEKRLLEAEEKIDKSNEFINESSKLSKTTRICLILLMIVPAIQLLLCAIVVYCLGINDKLPKLLNYFISGISFASMVEVYYFIKDFKDIKERLSKIEDII